MELDEFDRRLLDALQQDSRRTGEQLATLVGLSPAACLRRVQRLRETGVIEREVAIVAPSATGRPLSMVLTVTLEGEQQDTFDTFKRALSRAPEVLHCYQVAGPNDFVLVIATENMEAYEAFTKRLLFGKHVKRFEAMVVINRVKFETMVPLTGTGGG